MNVVPNSFEDTFECPFDDEDVPVDPFIDGLNQRTREEVMQEIKEHGGQVCARTRDGREVFHYAATHQQLYALLEESKIGDHEYVIDMVPPRCDGNDVFPSS